MPTFVDVKNNKRMLIIEAGDTVIINGEEIILDKEDVIIHRQDCYIEATSFVDYWIRTPNGQSFRPTITKGRAEKKIEELRETGHCL